MDAAVNKGCWGGGLFSDDDGHCLGILLQRNPSEPWRERYAEVQGGDAQAGPGHVHDDGSDEGDDAEEWDIRHPSWQTLSYSASSLGAAHLAVASSGEQENVAHAVPTCVVSHFLADLKRHTGAYRGFPVLGFRWQHLQSPALRSMVSQGTGHQVSGGLLVWQQGSCNSSSKDTMACYTAAW